MPDTKPAVINGQEWESSESGFAIDDTTVGDPYVHVNVYTIDDLGPSCMTSLNATQIREIAASLVQRADLLDPPSRRKLGPCPSTPSEIIGDFLRQGEILRKLVFSVGSDPEGGHRIAQLCDGFAIVALMAELEQLASDRAETIARQIADCWEDGGSVGEFLYDWNEAHKAGRPVGFNPPPVLPLDLTRAPS